MTSIIPVLLAGGSGTRLWPLSRKSYPKQFSLLMDGETLFQLSARRTLSSSHLQFDPHITVTNNEFRFIVGKQLQDAGITPGPILIEPEGKNTAPAILAASLWAVKEKPDAILLVAPSDHLIPDVDAFHRAVQSSLEAITNGHIVTFGITPSRPETGYGYLHVADQPEDQILAVQTFVEKPDQERAQKMLEEGHYLWNAGIFAFRAQDMIEAFARHAPHLLDSVSKAVGEGRHDLDFFRLQEEAWERCENISIDYAIMEKADNLVACRFSEKWSDLGGWDAVWQDMGPDKNGVVTSRNAHAIECENTLLRSESHEQEIVGLGLKDIIAVAMPDAVLVAHKEQSQNVKKVIAELKKHDVRQAELAPKDHRPWGWFETLAIRGRFQVKRILVNPGAALSLQSHHHRSEHWIVVEGTARVSLNEEIKLISEGQSVYIPLGAKHRLENPGKVPMVLIEVQTGSYLGEDDIIRYEDIYHRK